jgi:hypothetical protein
VPLHGSDLSQGLKVVHSGQVADDAVTSERRRHITSTRTASSDAKDSDCRARVAKEGLEERTHDYT